MFILKTLSSLGGGGVIELEFKITDEKGIIISGSQVLLEEIHATPYSFMLKKAQEFAVDLADMLMHIKYSEMKRHDS